MKAPAEYSVIAAQFNKELVEGMIAAALAEMEAGGLPLRRILRVPGCYEIPVIADLELRRQDVCGLIALGYIERGETLHGEVMGHVVNRALIDAQIKWRKPIGIGIIGPGATIEQAMERQVPVAKDAVLAAKEVAGILRASEAESAGSTSAN